MFGTTGTVAKLSIPKGDHGYISWCETQRFADKPKIVALPNVIAALELQPFGQFRRLCEYRGVRVLFELCVKTAQPAVVFVVHTGLDELVFGQGKQHFGLYA